MMSGKQRRLLTETGANKSSIQGTGLTSHVSLRAFIANNSGQYAAGCRVFIRLQQQCLRTGCRSAGIGSGGRGNRWPGGGNSAALLRYCAGGPTGHPDFSGERYAERRSEERRVGKA